MPAGAKAGRRRDTSSELASGKNVGACDDGPKGASHPPGRAISQKRLRSLQFLIFQKHPGVFTPEYIGNVFDLVWREAMKTP
ncbi:MAG: hypothetical protein CMH98_11360 [Oceanospirillaceae bacterium]|nr:hypothetical protein [Oceanospirillaceae bacterium]